MYEINFKETRKIIMEKTSNDNEYQDKKRKEKKEKFGMLCKIHQHVLNRNFNF